MTPRRRRKTQKINPIFVALLLIVLCTVPVSLGLRALTHQAKNAGTETITTTQATRPSAQAPATPTVTATATLASFGDLLMHRPIIEACLMDSGEYDFSTLFQYVATEIQGYDYALANLETSLGGPDCGIRYQGSPNFNCPDAIVDAVAKAGFQMLLTANNHCADTGAAGVQRTVKVIREKGLDNLGSSESSQEPKHRVVDVNGIRIGMLCYTYADVADASGAPGFNYQDPISQTGLINYYLNSDLNSFYTQVQSELALLKQQGAEVSVLYIHWGPEEYQLQANNSQRAIAQKLCDLGVDVIIGGHPHVVEPVELLTSGQDPEHKTVCIYSLGNAVSNQRIEEMSMKSGHTEDGAVFTVTFEKYSDGKVYVKDCDVLPLWVNKFSTGPRYEFDILPLDKSQASQWIQRFSLTAEGYTQAQSSYDRTMATVGPGLTTCRSYLAQAKNQRDTAYSH